MIYNGGVLKKNIPALSRREFLTTAAGAGGAMLLAPAWLNAAADGVDPRVAQVMSRTIGIDMHNHVYPAGTEPHPQRGQPQRQEEQPQAPDPFLAEELKRSGLTAVCASFVLDFAPNDKPGDARDNFLRWLTAIDAQLEKGHMHRALNLKDLQAAHDHGQPTIVQTVEGAHFIEGHLDRVEEVYKRGLRHLQLLHERDDMVSPLGDTNTAPAHLGGLTAFGAEVVKECNRLGILVDLAHASHETVLGALKVATQPLIVSHTSLDSRTGGNPRMAEMMKPTADQQRTREGRGRRRRRDRRVDETGRLAERVRGKHQGHGGRRGIDHVGIGSDTDLLLLAGWPGHQQGLGGYDGRIFPGGCRRNAGAGLHTWRYRQGRRRKLLPNVFDKATAGHA